MGGALAPNRVLLYDEGKEGVEAILWKPASPKKSSQREAAKLPRGDTEGWVEKKEKEKEKYAVR
jgi:hypothetical protein